MANWKKPSGIEIETNDMDATIDYCKSLDWKRIKNTLKGDPEVKPKKGKVTSTTANPKQMNND